MPDSDSDWIFDYVMHLFKSPAWELPIMTFIDEHCIVFDSEEENKFCYTDAHNQFREVVDSMLSTHLNEIGVTSEDFAEACASSRFSREVNTLVFEQLASCDDFLTFKKMMVKRNMELELEAVRAFKALSAEERAGDADDIPDPLPDSDDDIVVDASAAADSGDGENDDVAEQAIAERLRREAEEEARMLEEVLERSAKEAADAGRADKEQLDRELQAAIDNNLTEMEMLHKRELMEQMELETAISMSLAIEEERLRIARAEAKKNDEQEELDRAARIAAKAPSLDDDEPSQPSAAAPAKEVASPAAAPSSKGEPSAKGVAGGQAKRLSGGNASTAAAAAAAAAPSEMEALPVLRSMPAQGSSKTPLSELQSQMNERKRVAEETIRRNKLQLQQQKIKQQELRALADVSDTEVERRRQHLLKQRERIIAAKKAEREKKLQRYNEEQERKGADASSPVRPAAAVTEGGAESKQSMSEADERRQAMRIALAQRMKADLLQSDSERLAKVQAEQFANLDDRLRTVERTREENRVREEEMYRQLQRAQELRSRNLQASARNLNSQRGNEEEDFAFSEM